MRVLSVSQINFFIKSLIEGDGRMRDIYARGEISNFTDHYRSGHLYFSLKDEKSVLKAVMFSSAARRLRFCPKEGMRVIVRGRVAVYEPGGQYQFYVEEMQPDGVGALSLAFEQLKEKLAAEGLFAEEHKRPIPPFPARIGVITSPTVRRCRIFATYSRGAGLRRRSCFARCLCRARTQRRSLRRR